ncbi:MAG TPA: pitrilysin family protein [Methylomirabilota bacterium]|nr:pitrilysin family protein [Methylomirabilota bacterium]
MGYAVLVALIALAVPMAARAQPAPVKERLPNGLTAIVTENPAAPVVAASLFVRVGTRWESEEQAGITSLLQQVVLKGTATRSALDMAEAAEMIGGRLGASADTDFSEIRGAALGRHWERLLELVADAATHGTLAEREVEGERQAAVRALHTRQDQPFPRALDTLMRRLYGTYPYGLPVAGRPETVERLDRAALMAHYRRYYRAGRMILSVSGDVRRAEVLASARRLFADAPAGDGGPDPVLPAARATLDRVTVARPSAQAQVLIGFLAPPAIHPDYAPVKVLSVALGGGMSGRLFAELRDKQGLAYVTGASYPTRVGPSYVLAQIGTAPANAARAEEGVKRELERLRQAPLSPPELDRAKAYLLGQFALDRRTNARLAWYAAFFEATGLGHDAAERYPRAVEAVTAEDVRRVAQTYLGSPTIVSLGPAP